jgi:calcineurin-like phosphoesterase family protein
MMKRWVTADWHLGEDRWKIMQRPGFKDAQDMVDQLVAAHNALVSEGDLVLVVGDAVNLNTPEFLEQVSRFNGNKVLFRGNHDRDFSDEDLAPYFENVIPEGEGRVYETPEHRFWVTHYPTQARHDMFNLVGHIHGAWKFQLNAINVGVDANHWQPHDLDEDIPFFVRAISSFYDEDVWTAYHESNLRHLNVRGKAGRYLDVDGKVGGGT